MAAFPERLAFWRKRAPVAARSTRTGLRIGLVAGALLLLFFLILGWFWSRTPDVLWVSSEKDGEPVVTGYATTETLIRTAQTLLDKPGGYLSNDIAPPGVFLDNMPNWEYGVLVQVRDLARVLRNDYGRSQSQSIEDPDLAEAEPKFNFDSDSWWLPSSQGQYRDGIEHLQSYLERLDRVDQPNAQFYARADNLREWLTVVEKRLGNLSQRLTASVGQRRVNTDLAGDSAAQQATPTPGEVEAKTPWLEIDDVFFEARGAAWALAQFLRATEFDFAEVLRKKNATISLRQIIRELEASLQPLSSPIVLNGSGFGMFANHSLVMASYISRANAAVIDLRQLLEEG